MNGTRHGNRKSAAAFFQRLPVEAWFTILALLIWAGIQGSFGITWDEPEQADYGEAVRKYFFSHQSFSDFCNHGLPGNAYYYGPALSLLCAMISHAFGTDIYVVRHGVQGLLWVAMFYPVCALGRRISGLNGAWCAGLALLGIPSLLGQGFNNPKDLPLACASIWLLYVCVTAVSARKLNWRHAVNLGAAVGFVLAMRPGAWFLCALLALLPLASAWRAYRQTRRLHVLCVLRGTLPVLCGAIVIGWVIMILPWANAWHSPLKFPVTAARYAMHFDAVYPVLFHGHYFPSNQLPWNYLAGYLLLTLPVPILILAAWGHLSLWRRSVRSIPAAMATGGILFLVWLPLVSFMATRPNIYDGMRH